MIKILGWVRVAYPYIFVCAVSFYDTLCMEELLFVAMRIFSTCYHSIYSQTFQDTWKCSKIYENVPRYMKMFQDIWKRSKIYENVPRYMKKFQDIWQRSKIHENIQRYMKTFQDIWKRSKIHENIPRYMKLFHSYSFMLWAMVACCKQIIVWRIWNFDTNMIQTNIRGRKYSKIFEYPNICHTMKQISPISVHCSPSQIGLKVATQLFSVARPR